jgi:hypothetical protein
MWELILERPLAGQFLEVCEGLLGGAYKGGEEL